MKQTTKSAKMTMQRKFLMKLPLLILPFVTLLFWALGGGKKANAQASSGFQKRLDVTLPVAALDDNEYLSKMSYYHQAALDSSKRRQQIQNDPYYSDDSVSTQSLETGNDGNNTLANYGLNNNGDDVYSHFSDPNEAKVYQKLAQLNAALDKTTTTPDTTTSVSVGKRSNTVVPSANVDRLEQMMQTMNQPEGEDPEMKQLNGMLEKILDIQHPDRVTEKLKATSLAQRGEVFAVSAERVSNPVSWFGADISDSADPYTGLQTVKQQNGFYSLEIDGASDEKSNSIRAVVHENQTLVNGSTVKLRLADDIYINGRMIPKGNFLYGTASLNGERLNIQINSIRYKNSLYPVQLSAYDLDGLDGIYIPGAITRDVAKQSADRAVQGLGLTTLDPSLGAQAAGAGIEAARNLISKKAKLVKVTVKAGYRVLLKDENQKKNG